MKNFLIELQHQSEMLEEIVTKIENGEAYMEELKAYLPVLNQTITTLFGMIKNPAIHLEINPDFVLQVLNDIIYGIEKEDPVYLADVLRYGLIEVYGYVGTELQREDHNE